MFEKVDLTFFFLLFYGGICCLTFFACVVSKNARQGIIKITKEDIILLGFIGIVISLPIVILHNKWDNFYAIIVSVFAWMGLLKNFTRILNLGYLQKYQNNILDNDKKFLLSCYFGLFIGIILIFLAYLSKIQ